MPTLRLSSSCWRSSCRPSGVLQGSVGAPVKKMRPPRPLCTQELVRKGIASFSLPLGQTRACSSREKGASQGSGSKLPSAGARQVQKDPHAPKLQLSCTQHPQILTRSLNPSKVLTVARYTRSILDPEDSQLVGFLVTSRAPAV